MHLISPRSILDPQLPLQFGRIASIRFRCCASLKSQVTKVDGAFDKCSNAWCTGEAEGFFTEKFLSLRYRIRDSCQRKTRMVHCFDFVHSAHEAFTCDVSTRSILRFYTEAEKVMKETTYVSSPRFDISSEKSMQLRSTTGFQPILGLTQGSQRPMEWR